MRHRALLVIALALCGWHAASAAAQSAPGEPLKLGPAQLLGDGAGHLDLGAGVYDLIGDHHHYETGTVDAEYRFGQKFYHVGPALGVIGDARGGGLAYAAIYSDIALGPAVLTPLGGLGAWWRGGHNDENLGGTFEFRVSLEAAYRFSGWRPAWPALRPYFQRRYPSGQSRRKRPDADLRLSPELLTELRRPGGQSSDFRKRRMLIVRRPTPSAAMPSMSGHSASRPTPLRNVARMTTR